MEFRVTTEDGDQRLKVTGRSAWLLSLLVKAADEGLSARQLPAGLRLAGYVHNLRNAGVAIRTSYEANDGSYGGAHGVYRLESAVQPIEEGEE